MQTKNKSKWFGLGFLVLLTSFPVFVGIHFSDPGNNVFFQGVRERKAGTDFKKGSKVLQGKVFLLKDNSITVNRTRLVYKGLHDKRILLEYYLLELDPDFPYRNQVSKAEARQGIRLGDSLFQLVSVSRSALTLQANNLYRAY
ncbi:MAG: hypothetical protein MI892_03340 [Desulfobacterales bacterium]|nr:hypothetical protein [Desulfobacterales bacterium]